MFNTLSPYEITIGFFDLRVDFAFSSTCAYTICNGPVSSYTHTHRLARLLQQLRLAYPKSRFGLSFLQLTCIITLAAHWMCCFWFFIGYTPDGWVVSAGLADVEEGKDDVLMLVPKHAISSNVVPGSFGDGSDGLWGDGHVYEWITRLNLQNPIALCTVPKLLWPILRLTNFVSFSDALIRVCCECAVCIGP